MNYSINIGDKNTYDDWHLIFPGKPIVNPPIPQFNYVEVLGKSGSLDYTEALTKVPRYGDREGSWEFVVLNPGDANDFMTIDDFKTNKTDLYSAITSYCNGRYFEKVWLEEDPEYYYSGRVWLSGIQSSSGWARVTLSYRFEPFKKSFNESKHETITVSDQSISHMAEKSFYASESVYPSQFYYKPLTDPDGLSALMFLNAELNISPTQMFDSTDKIYHNRNMLVSNIYGDNRIRIILYGDVSSSVEYWWIEERL